MLYNLCAQNYSGDNRKFAIYHNVVSFEYRKDSDVLELTCMAINSYSGAWSICSFSLKVADYTGLEFTAIREMDALTEELIKEVLM